MMETILQWDTALMHWINSGWSNPVLDVLFPAIRNKFVWVPLYILCLSWMMFNLTGRQLTYTFLFIAISIFASDNISSKLIKDQVQRPRPCQVHQMDPPVIARIGCGSGYSFTSSHASNHFCMAAFLVAVFGSYMRGWKYGWWVWASLISIAQVYVGVHYPLDVFIGAMLGIVIGSSMGIFCRYKIRWGRT
jgi:undecaprenyl-diphosphatase